MQPPRSYSVGGQHRSRQLTGKPAGAQPDYLRRWCTTGDAERFLGGKQLPRAFPPAPSLPIAWNGDSSAGEGKERQSSRMRKTTRTVSCVGYFTESCGEDAATSL
ncbi:UNVERIFIED_CONTAM: hypothetical protein FKN15_028543 [Acipenser sinensis]